MKLEIIKVFVREPFGKFKELESFSNKTFPSFSGLMKQIWLSQISEAPFLEVKVSSFNLLRYYRLNLKKGTYYQILKNSYLWKKK